MHLRRVGWLPHRLPTHRRRIRKLYLPSQENRDKDPVIGRVFVLSLFPTLNLRNRGINRFEKAISTKAKKSFNSNILNTVNHSSSRHSCNVLIPPFPVPRVQRKYSPSALADYRPRTNTPSAEDKITLSEARIMRTETTVDLPRHPKVPATTQAALLALLNALTSRLSTNSPPCS